MKPMNTKHDSHFHNKRPTGLPHTCKPPPKTLVTRTGEGLPPPPPSPLEAMPPWAAARLPLPLPLAGSSAAPGEENRLGAAATVATAAVTGVADAATAAGCWSSPTPFQRASFGRFWEKITPPKFDDRVREKSRSRKGCGLGWVGRVQKGVGGEEKKAVVCRALALATIVVKLP